MLTAFENIAFQAVPQAAEAQDGVPTGSSADTGKPGCGGQTRIFVLTGRNVIDTPAATMARPMTRATRYSASPLMVIVGLVPDDRDDDAADHDDAKCKEYNHGRVMRLPRNCWMPLAR